MSKLEKKPIQSLMNESGYKVKFILKQLGMSKSAYQRRLSGEVDWKISECEDFANFFGMKIDQISFKREVE